MSLLSSSNQITENDDLIQFQWCSGRAFAIGLCVAELRSLCTNTSCTMSLSLRTYGQTSLWAADVWISATEVVLFSNHKWHLRYSRWLSDIRKTPSYNEENIKVPPVSPERTISDYRYQHPRAFAEEQNEYPIIVIMTDMFSKLTEAPRRQNLH